MIDSSAVADPFRLGPLNENYKTKIVSIAARGAASLLSLNRCSRLYAGLSATDPDAFCGEALRSLGIEFAPSAEDLARIPERGPLVVVANHPFGAVEGLALLAMLQRVRPDVRVMANSLLERLPQLRNSLIAVDPYGRADSPRRNLQPLRESLRWVRQGGALILFPAGEVSHLNLARRTITDPPWTQDLARIVRRTGAAVLPVYFPGANGPLFQALGLLHPRLRTALLPHEMLNKKDRQLLVRVGSPILFRKLEGMDDAPMVDYLRLRTYLLARRQKPQAPAAPSTGLAPVAEPLSPRLLAEEIARLPAESVLLESGDYRVFAAEATHIPSLLQEIGRLREITFRAAGEGTGLACDLDRFDNLYTHLILWNAESRDVVGAYRLGRSDKLLARFGTRGLYTSTLFRYRRALLENLGPALEMGRSFVRPEYQRSFSPLLLLWKGIGHFVVRHPEYRMLFGPVSISRDYSPLSRQLMAASLGTSCTIGELSHLVRPRNPLRFRPLRVKGCAAGHMRNLLRNFDEISALVADLEADGKGIPVLLRQYLGLGGKLLAFNVDADFSDVLDGLILVDLCRTEPRTLERYLGREGSRQFLAYHIRDEAAGAAH
jgi:putative hemolysin